MCLQVPLAIATLVDPKMIKDRLYSTSSTSTTMLAIASGYFVHDLVICTLQLSTWGPAYLFHALFCSLLYCYGLSSGVLHYYGKQAYLNIQQARIALQLWAWSCVADMSWQPSYSCMFLMLTGTHFMRTHCVLLGMHNGVSTSCCLVAVVHCLT